MLRKGDDWRADIKIARELCYPDSVIRALQSEEDKNKRNQILRNARKEEINKQLGGKR